MCCLKQAEIEGYIAEFLEIGQRESRVVLRAIASQHGLLIERSQTEGVVFLTPNISGVFRRLLYGSRQSSI